MKRKPLIRPSLFLIFVFMNIALLGCEKNRAQAYYALAFEYEKVMEKNPSENKEENQKKQESYIQKALELNPNKEFHIFYAHILTKESRFEEAVKQYNFALKLDPEDPLLYEALARLLFLEEMSQEQALKYAEKALELGDSLQGDRKASILETLAGGYFIQKDYEKALRLQNQALETAKHPRSRQRIEKQLRIYLEKNKNQK